MNGNTKKRLGRHRRSVIIEPMTAQHASTKASYKTYKIVGPGVRGERIDTGKLRKEHGKTKMSHAEAVKAR